MRGGNTVFDISSIETVSASSPHLARTHSAVLEKDTAIGEFHVPDLQIVQDARDGSPVLKLKFETVLSRQSNRGGQTPLQPLELTVGAGFKPSAHIVRLLVCSPTESTFVTGQQVPNVEVQMQAEDTSIKDFSNFDDTAFSTTSSGGGVPTGRIVSVSATGHAIIAFRNADDTPCLFTTPGVVRVTVQYTEQREEWAWLHASLRSASSPLMMEFTVRSDDSMPQLVLVNIPPDTLFLTNESTHKCKGRLYSVKDRDQPQSYEPKLHLTDSFDNPLASTAFQARVELQKLPPQVASAASSSGSAAAAPEVLGVWTSALSSGALPLRGTDPRAPIIEGMFPGVQLELDSHYAIAAQATIQSSGQAISLKRLLLFTYTASARRDELLSALKTFQRNLEATRLVHNSSVQTCEAILGRPLQQDDSVENHRAQLEKEVQRLQRDERKLDELRPTRLRGVMPALILHTWKLPGFLGLLAEFIAVSDPQLASHLSLTRGLNTNLTNLLVRDKAAADLLKQLHRNHTVSLSGRHIIELARLPSDVPGAQPLPHQQATGLRNNLADREQQVAWLNLKVNGHDRIRRLADLVQHVNDIGLSEHEGRQLIHHSFVGNRLVVDHKQDALQYSRLVRSHPPIFCLDTGTIEHQGGAESIDEQLRPAAAASSRGEGSASLFLDQVRWEKLKQKQTLLAAMRKRDQLLTAMDQMVKDRHAMRALETDVAQQHRIFDELKKLEEQCTRAGQRPRMDEVDAVAAFLVDAGGKRPAAGSRQQARGSATSASASAGSGGHHSSSDKDELPLRARRR